MTAYYAYINMVDAIKRVPGVGDVQVFGAGRYAMRIWLNPEKMAALNITARDVMLAVQAQNAVNPAGKIGAQPAPPDQQLSFTVKAPGRLTSVKEFENIVVRGQDSSIVRVGDIARVELGSETYSLSSSVNGMPAASIESEISAMPLAPLQSAAMRSTSGCRCSPSAMTCTMILASARPAPGTPGLRWCSGL